MNKLILSGRLTKDAVAGATQKGNGYVAFTVAVDRDYKDANGNVPTDFISVFYHTKTGDGATKFASYLKKGSAVEIVGSLHSKNVEKDGQKMTELSVVAESVKFALTNASKSDNTTTATEAPATTVTPAATTTTVAEVTDDDLPF